MEVSGKKGIYFTLDALLAASIIFLGFLLVPSIDFNKQTTTHMSYISNDLVTALSIIKVSEINNTYVKELIANGKITRLNNTLLEQIGEFWVSNESAIAYNFTRALTNDVVPGDFSYGVWAGDEEIYSRSNGNGTTTISARKIISGYAKARPIYGYTSRIHLSSIKSRTSSALVYFGGFVGEGNITGKIILPQNITNITQMKIEAVVGTDFKLFINGVYSGDFPAGSGNGSQIEPDLFYVDSAYFTNLDPGENNLTLRFIYIDENYTAEGPKYIGGGYIKTTYVTPDTADLEATYHADGTVTKKYWFNGIDGFINLYSSIYVPGNLTAMKVYLDITSNHTAYLTIGNTTVFDSNPGGARQITINNTQLIANFSANGVDYSDMNLVSTPIRLGLRNVSRTSAPLDAALVTDVSGSMDWRLDSDVSGTARNCNDPNLNLLSTKRISVAKCADIDFLNTILANSGPLVGLVSYDDVIVNSMMLTDSLTNLTSQINSYAPGGSTCVCCGVNGAVGILMNDTQIVVIPRKSAGWRYNDTNLISAPTNWTKLAAKDGGWRLGTAALGNGYAGLNTVISKYEGNYYFRKKFNITNASTYVAAKAYVYSDGGADVYFNEHLVDSDAGSRHNAAYWNRVITIDPSYIVEGENIVAVRLQNRKQGSVLRNPAFDFEMVMSQRNSIETSKKKVMLVMTDGAANVECSEQGVTGDLDHDGTADTAKDDAVKAACDAYTNYGISVYTVGFGTSADSRSLGYMANCTDGKYYSSTNYNELRDSYLIIANELIQLTETQGANASGVSQSRLYVNSYIELNYTPETANQVYGEIPVTAETNAFGNNISQGSIYIAPGNTLVDLAATSYSADKWTDFASVTTGATTKEVFNLSRFGNLYYTLGDAFDVHIPVSKVTIGQSNLVTVRTGTSPANATGGSAYNRLFYTVRISSLLGYSNVYAERDGCNWFVKFYDGTNATVKIPSTYTGASNCSFHPASFNSNDAVDNAAYALFDKLDFDKDGSLEIKLDENNLAVDSVTVSDVPSLWGPAIVEVRMW